MSDLLILEEFIRESLLDEDKRGKKKGKKKATRKKSAAGGLSAKTKETLNNKADARGYTRGSVYQEYRNV